ncbi:MAG: hypothetical protein AAF368_20385, partial [Planctomycetota bacterium]
MIPARLLLTTFLILTPLAAEEVTLEFVCLPRGFGLVELKLLAGDEKVIDVRMNSTEVSQAVTVPRLAEYRFGIIDESEGDAPGFRLLAKARPLASKKQLFVFLKRGEDTRDGFHIVPFA